MVLRLYETGNHGSDVPVGRRIARPVGRSLLRRRAEVAAGRGVQIVESPTIIDGTRAAGTDDRDR